MSTPASGVERTRHLVGFIAAPAVFAGLLLLPQPSLSAEAHRLAAVMAAVVILWMTEAIPLPVTAILGAAVCVILRIAPAREVFAPFADPLMFLFIGSFIIARAIFLNGLDRRLAFGVLSIHWVGARPGRILFAYGAVTLFISAWISNTATTAMMLTIGMAIIAFLSDRDRAGGVQIDPRFATGLMLMTAFAASIGGLATPIGTPPNIIGLSFIRELLGVEFSFFKWMLIGAPAALLLFLWLFTYLNAVCKAGVDEIPNSADMLRVERDRLGPWTRAQKSTLAAFLITVSLWVFPGILALVFGESSTIYRQVSGSMPEAVAAVIGATMLFLLPGEGARRAITWEEAATIDWGVVLLYGGGFALGVLSFQTGLAEAVGVGLTGLVPISGQLGMVIAAAVVAVVVSETTSNTASANMVVPVVIALAQAQGVDPLAPAIAATMAASLGFMLPVSTPCNAIVYGSGLVPLRSMIRYGLVLDVAGIIVIVTLVQILVPLLRP